MTKISSLVPKGSIILAGTTLFSYALGLLRDRLLATSFGASVSLDSYNAAFLLPDFLFNFLVASGIAAAAVPLFTKLYAADHHRAYEYVNSLLVSAMGVMCVAGVGIGLFAWPLSFLIAPGFEGESRDLVVVMMRILATSSVLFAASNALGAMLVAQKRFLFYGISPIAYNVGIIFGVLVLAPSMGVVGVAVGTVFGALLHLLVRLIDSYRSGWRYGLILTPWTIPAMKRTVVLMLPKMVGHPVEMLTFAVFTSLASFLEPGSITVINFARNFQSVPVSLLGISISTAAFPLLAEAMLTSTKETRSLLYRTGGTIFLTSILAALCIYLIRYPLITTLLGGGAFDAHAIGITATVLGVFCLSIPTESMSHLLARAFYAAENTTIPVICSVISLIVSGAIAYTSIHTIGILGIPVGFFFGSLAKTLGLWGMFGRRLSPR